MTTRSYKHKILKTQDCTNTRSYKHKIVQTQDRILVPVTGGTDLWPVHARTVFPIWSYDIASMLVRYFFLTLSSHSHRCYWPVTCPCSYNIDFMLVQYCLYARTVLPLCSYVIASMLVRYCLHDRTIWPVYFPLTPSSHGNRRYWPVTCPCSLGT